MPPDWNWIVAATLLLGVNQGLCWSMTQTAKLDITKAEERGLVMGLNEFSGYVGVASAGILTAYIAEALGARTDFWSSACPWFCWHCCSRWSGSRTRSLGPGQRPAAHKAAPPKSLPRYPEGFL